MWDEYADLAPFKREEAAKLGLTDADVRRLLTRGVLVRLAHGLLAGSLRPELAADAVDRMAIRVLAMQRRYPNAVAGLSSAAVLRQLWLVGAPGPVQLLRVRGYPRRKHDVMVDSVPLPTHHLSVVAGVVATGVTRTAIDLVARLPGGEALAVADSALHVGADLPELLAMAAEMGHRPGGAVHRVLELADAQSQSALESMSRWLFRIANLPTPELQVLIGDDDGPFALVDFLWREHAVIGEADGLLKYDEAPDALRKEKLRQERLEAMGYTVVRWGFRDVTDYAAPTVARVRRALARADVRHTRAG